MNSNAYTEDPLVEQPAIGLFPVLGWQTVSALDKRVVDVHWFIICQLSGNMGTPLF